MVVTSRLARTVVDNITSAFEGARDTTAAPAMKAYMRDQFDFCGISAPQRETLTRNAVAESPKPTEQDLIAIARSLWRKREREYQYAGAWYLRRNVKALTPASIEDLRFLITTKSWWDTVDELAQNVVGPVVLANRSALQPQMDDWVADPNMWVARTAILHQNRFKADTDTDRLFGYCLSRAADTEFFIRKAIGWALREYSKTDARAVRLFVKRHDTELSGLSKTEALKWLERRAHMRD